MSSSWRYAFIFLLTSVLLVFFAAFSIPDGKLHLVFCDVGQGDAVLIYQGSSQILVDGGPDASVLSCLSKHMPFWDRKIEAVVMTHPDEDHFGGLVDVVRRYEVGMFLTPGIGKESVGFGTLKKEIENKRIGVKSLGSGDVLRNDKISIDTVWPARHASLDLAIGASGNVLGATTVKNPNEFSIVQRVSYGEFDALLTGDIVPPTSDIVAEGLDGSEEIEVLKVPHHGSKNGLTKRLLDRARPKLAVISAGEKNRYGHPHEEILKMLREMGDMRVLRTDIDGEIEVVSDGRKWWIEK